MFYRVSVHLPNYGTVTELYRDYDDALAHYSRAAQMLRGRHGAKVKMAVKLYGQWASYNEFWG